MAIGKFRRKSYKTTQGRDRGSIALKKKGFDVVDYAKTHKGLGIGYAKSSDAGYDDELLRQRENKFWRQVTASRIVNEDSYCQQCSTRRIARWILKFAYPGNGKTKRSVIQGSLKVCDDCMAWIGAEKET